MLRELRRVALARLARFARRALGRIAADLGLQLDEVPEASMSAAAVTRLAIADASKRRSPPSPDVRSILDCALAAPHPTLAESAIRKVERRTKSPT